MMVFEREFFAGLDLGQKRDYTALAVLERARVRTGEMDWINHTPVVANRWTVPVAERMRLGTSYPAIVERVRARVQLLADEGWCTLIVDETGVGAPVVDLLRGANLRCRIVPVTITAGGTAHRGHGGRWNVPKRELVTSVRLLLAGAGLRVRRAADGEALVNELLNMRVRVNAAGYESFAARSEGTHDDLAMALALACWAARRGLTSPKA